MVLFHYLIKNWQWVGGNFGHPYIIAGIARKKHSSPSLAVSQNVSTWVQKYCGIIRKMLINITERNVISSRISYPRKPRIYQNVLVDGMVMFDPK